MKLKLILIFLFISTNVFAEDIQVFFSKGKVVSIDGEGTQKKVKKGDYLVEGEILKTAEKSFAILKIGKHSTHRVEENSEIIIEQLPYMYEDSSELEQGGRFFLKLGTIFSEIYKKADNDSFEIKTKNTTMGVRGTKLMASIDSDSTDTWLSVSEGTVEVSNNTSSARDIVEKDQSMIIEKDKNFTKQKRYEWQRNLKWNIEKNKDNFKSFKKQRKLAYKEFRQRRSGWIRNEARWSEFKKTRKEKITKFKNRIKKLKGNENLKKRKELRLKKKSLVKDLKKKKVQRKQKRKTFYKKGMLKKNDSFKSNSFLQNKKKKKPLLKKKKNLQQLQNQRRRLKKIKLQEQ